MATVTLFRSETCLRCGRDLPEGSRVRRVTLTSGRGYTHQQHCVRPVVQVETPEAEPLATERQVAFALACNQVVGPSERYTVEQLRAMRRSEISRVITLRSDLL